MADSILSGFGSVFAFRLNDQKSRDFITGRHGSANRLISLLASNATKGVQDMLVAGKVIEDLDIVAKLGVGECIVSLYQGDPFLFYPIKYESNNN